jgi:hypothetical protein
MSALDRAAREELLDRARRLAATLPPSTLKQAAAALAILRQQGPEVLSAALGPDAEYHIEASAPDWQEFRAKVGADVVRLLRHDPRAASYLLAWLKRLGSIRSSATARRAR